jgi:serine/threonine protein kinase
MAKIELDAATWATLNRLLDEALDRPPEQRAAWLESLGEELAPLKPRLRELLANAAQVETGDFLHTLPKFAVAQAQAEAPTGAAGEVLGPYRLLREIGSGGMGSVWLAERVDGLIKRPVALKLPHVSHASRAGLAERMARERAILATLDHRNIARLLDAGVTAEGQPFLALEYVEGVAIDRYCAGGGDMAPLAIPARLKLFRQVTDAVAYAHGKLVLHRDLKPANILVGTDGGVRLLDFGIAKLLEEGGTQSTPLTEAAGHALTPDYASPEQILGNPLTVASDVYSLGVILFELLTGSRPYKLKRDSRGALEDAIVQSIPARASEVAPLEWRKTLRGDLDTILAKTLKKDPNERYPGASALAEDLTRYLTDRPVTARPDSGWYRLRKFVARNKLGVAVSAATTVAVLSSNAFALLQMEEARAQRDAAELQRQRAATTNEFLNMVLDDAGGAGKPMTLAESLDRTTSMMEHQYASDAPLYAGLLFEASRRYSAIGKKERELALLDRVAGTARDTNDADLLATAQCSAVEPLIETDMALATGRMKEVDALIARGQTISASASWVCDRARALLLEAEGKTAEAIALLDRTLSSTRPETPMPVMTRTALLGDVSHLRYKSDDVAGSLANVDESIRLFEESGRGESMNMVITLLNHAAILTRAGEVGEAAREQKRALEMVSRYEAGGEPPLGFATHLANSYLRLTHFEDAARLAMREGERARAEGNQRLSNSSDLVAARALGKLGRFEESAQVLARAEKGFQVNAKANQRLLNEVALTRADQLLQRGDTAGARRIVDEIIGAMKYPEQKTAPGLASALFVGARVALAQGDGVAAEQWAADAIPFEEKTVRSTDRSGSWGQAVLNRAEALALLKRNAEALEQALKAEKSLTTGFSASHPDTVRARELIAKLKQT